MRNSLTWTLMWDLEMTYPIDNQKLLNESTDFTDEQKIFCLEVAEEFKEPAMENPVDGGNAYVTFVPNVFYPTSSPKEVADAIKSLGVNKMYIPCMIASEGRILTRMMRR